MRNFVRLSYLLALLMTLENLFLPQLLFLYQIAEVLPGPLKDRVIELCTSIDQDTTELTNLCREGRGGSARALALAKKIAANLDELKYAIETALVDKVIEDFLDIATPLAKFTEVVVAPHTGQFEERADQLSQFSDRMVRTAKMVAVGTGNANKKVAEAILAVSGQIESMTPQLINAGRIRMVYPENKAADEHFNNLKSQYSELLHQGRAWLDEVTDSKAFISRSLKAMQDHADHGNIFDNFRKKFQFGNSLCDLVMCRILIAETSAHYRYQSCLV